MPLHSKLSQQLNCPQEDLTEGSNRESALHGWVAWAVHVCVLCQEFCPGKVWPHYEAEEINQKAALQQGPAEVPGGGEGSLGPEARPQETRGRRFQWGRQRSGREPH